MIEQALYGSDGDHGYRFLARSPGFREEWLAAAERLCTDFGERPPDVTCPLCLFVQPFAGSYVAIVQAGDCGSDSEGRPGTLGFHLLLVPRALYADLHADPFHIAAQLPPPWDARGELPPLTWTAPPPAPRAVAALQKVLDVPNSATLLGGAQALLDGAGVVFERTGPDPMVVRSIWALLPAADRIELWPATYRFGNAEAFDLVVVPPKRGPEHPRYLTEERAGDYPEGRYELGLQIAVDAGNQAELDNLLNRRSRRQTIALTVGLLVAIVVLLLAPAALNLFLPEAPPPATVALELPPAADYPRLDDAERQDLATRLQQFGERLHKPLPTGSSEDELKATLAALDDALGTPDPARNPGKLSDQGPVQRQVQALLWKHDVAEYNRAGLRTPELVDRLENKVLAEKKP